MIAKFNQVRRFIISVPSLVLHGLTEFLGKQHAARQTALQSICLPDQVRDEFAAGIVV